MSLRERLDRIDEQAVGAGGKARAWHGYALASFGFLLFGLVTLIEPTRVVAGAMIGSAFTAAMVAVKVRKD